MDVQNVTVSLPVDVMRQARHLAVDRGVSLSKFVAMLVEEKVIVSREYDHARKQEIQRMQAGLDLGTRGNITWTRNELHDLRNPFQE
jgi:hypothetical protein